MNICEKIVLYDCSISCFQGEMLILGEFKCIEGDLLWKVILTLLVFNSHIGW